MSWRSAREIRCPLNYDLRKVIFGRLILRIVIVSKQSIVRKVILPCIEHPDTYRANQFSMVTWEMVYLVSVMLVPESITGIYSAFDHEVMWTIYLYESLILVDKNL